MVVAGDDPDKIERILQVLVPAEHVLDVGTTGVWTVFTIGYEVVNFAGSRDSTVDCPLNELSNARRIRLP